MDSQEFYAEVGAILGVDHEYVTPPAPGKKLRWGPRGPGNGRFPGHGIVRMFSPTVIHVALTKPVLFATFESPELALTAISQASLIS
jgi:hypothetical protein